MTSEIREKPQRIEKWDIARGILIFLVVLSHMVQYHTDDSENMRALYIFIFTFHMPCFVFLDGMFSKRNINEKRYSHIFSYLILYVFTKVLISLTTGIINHKFTFDLFSEGGAAWYGIALFIFSMVTIFLKRFPKKWVLCASIILACFIGYDNNIASFLSLARVFNFFPFFFLGYCIEPDQLAERLSSTRAKIGGYIALIIFAVICFLETDAVYFTRPLIMGRYPYSELSNYGMENLIVYGGPIRLLYYGIVIIIGLSFFAIIPKHVPKFLSGIETIGQRTLQIYILHRPVIYILYEGLHLNTWMAATGISKAIIIPIALLITLFLALPIWEKPIRAVIYPKSLQK